MQCRERYVNVLAPELNRDAWTEAEDAVILKGVQECRHADGTVRSVQFSHAAVPSLEYQACKSKGGS